MKLPVFLMLASLTAGSVALAQSGTDLAAVPASSEAGCGRISSFTSMPRSEGLFPIVLRRIDGKEIAGGGSPAVKVSAGSHSLMVADAIPPVEFNSTERAGLRQLRNRRMAQFKTFEVVVEPNTTYYLAAKLAPYPRDVINNAHWQPVIWRTRSERCR